jgi:hypothetical protein
MVIERVLKEKAWVSPFSPTLSQRERAYLNR